MDNKKEAANTDDTRIHFEALQENILKLKEINELKISKYVLDMVKPDNINTLKG